MNPNNHNLITLQQELINTSIGDDPEWRDNFRNHCVRVFMLEDCLMEEIED